MQVFMMRAINAVLKFTELSEDSIVDAAKSPRDLDVLVKGLLASPIVEDLKAIEPLTPAFIRGYEAKHKLIEEHGGTLSAEKVGEVLGISRQAVEKRRQAGKLLALTIGRHGYRYPVWQLNESGTLPGLEQALGVLSSHDQWMQTVFFVSRNPRLNNRTPIEMLEAGEIERVLNAASVYGEHGAA
jgi:biotin operon repressor